MKQLKDQEHTEAIIKLTKVREAFSDGKGAYAFKDKLFCIKITKSTVHQNWNFALQSRLAILNQLNSLNLIPTMRK